MHIHITSHVFNTTLNIPPSKSHTIRRLFMAALTDGISYIEHPLDSLDTRSCIAACLVFGAEISATSGKNGCPDVWTVRGQNPQTNNFSIVAENSEYPLHIDAGNSGTTLFFSIAAAALFSQDITFTGDSHIAKRSAGLLLDALTGLGVKVNSKNGYIPITICGPWKGGRVNLPCLTSQYLSALLIAAPLAPAGIITEIDVPLLNEKPYIEMTLAYLKTQGLYGGTYDKKCFDYKSNIVSDDAYSYFRIKGGNTYTPLNGPVPGDFSSAVFPTAAAVLSGGKAVLRGLDPNDTQGDKVFFEYLVQMGCEVQWKQTDSDWQVTVSRNGRLRGGVFDLNDTPDLFPVMAVLGAFSEGETSLTNAAHARIKETDRIAVMAEELRKLFAGKNNFHCVETPDGLMIRSVHDPHSRHQSYFSDSMDINGRKICVTLDGHGDHRITMALACAAMGLPANTGSVTITGAEAAAISYPGFWELIQ